jgi:T3SS negative regulator,GrlR
MMTEGIFSLIFESEQKQVGGGFAAFKDGRIRGGDAEFSYDGTYSLSETDQDSAPHFKAKISAQYYKGINLAIFGKIARIPMEISGVFTPEGISGNGTVTKIGTNEVNLNGVKIDEFQSETKEQWSLLSRPAISMSAAYDQYLTSALTTYQEGKYVDATNSAYAAIELIIRQLPVNLSNQPEKKDPNFLHLIDDLIEKDAGAAVLYKPIHALASSDEVLNKKSKSPENCAFPLCVMAFNTLEKLLKIQSSS